MTVWTTAVGELLDATADALICPANPQLNLSGGVGGAFQLRYGHAMQDFLHGWLKDRDLQYVNPGDTVVAPPCGSHFRAVVHAVAIDAFYDTSLVFIRDAYAKAFAAIAEMKCDSVASACLACGYGRLTPDVFISAMRGVIGSHMPGIANITLISTNADLIAAIRQAITELTATE
jgi:O-acetyl-ADP-ribose deacetylase (regulator of RNase III)